MTEQRHRSAIAGRRWPTGGALTLIVWREGGEVVLSHEGAARTTARLSPGEARRLAHMLTIAAEPGGSSRADP